MGHDPSFNRFRLIHPCDGRTDGQTDGRATAYTRYSIYAVARKNWRWFLAQNETTMSGKIGDGRLRVNRGRTERRQDRYLHICIALLNDPRVWVV